MPRRSEFAKDLTYSPAAQDMDNLLVQKSNPLQTLSQTNLTLPEFKILDAYLSRIDSRKPEARLVQFERGPWSGCWTWRRSPFPSWKSG